MPSAFDMSKYNMNFGGGGVGNPTDIGKYFFGTQLYPQFDYLTGIRNQNTYLSPEQYLKLFQQLTAPAEARLGQQYGQQQRGLASSFANRGNLFGGSLTGAQAQLGTGYNQALSDLFSNVGGQLGQLDLTLGAQRQGQAMQLIQALLSQILGGEYSIKAAKAGKPSEGLGGVLGGLGGLIGGIAGLGGDKK